MADTLLVLTGLGVPLYSARGLDQTLDAIDGAAEFDRDVNGSLVNLTPPQFLKYRSTISCTDFDAPAFDGLPLGTEVTVECVCELPYLTGTEEEPGIPSRTPVTGAPTRVVGDWTYYRPQLTMMVVGFSMQRDEYAHTVTWQLELEEV